MKSYTKRLIPYKGYFSSPFFSLAGQYGQYDNAKLSWGPTRREDGFLKKIDPAILDYMYFGSCCPESLVLFSSLRR